MKKIAVIALALSLAACAATPADQEASLNRVKSQLPAGCELIFVGSVEVSGSSHESNIFAVKCGDTVTTSINTDVQEGKTTRNQSDVVVTQN